MPRFHLTPILIWNKVKAIRTAIFFCVRCDDRANPQEVAARKSAVCCSLAACPQSLVPTSVSLAKTVGVLSPGVCRSGKCVQDFAPQSHIYNGLNQQDLISSCFLSPQ